ncbi:MAG: ABC transporter substrate-binding protein [Thermomicrobiales bacterium]
MAVVAGGVGVALLLQGCSTGGSSDSDDGTVQLSFLNQSRGQEETLVALAEEYGEQNGVTISVDSPGPADFPAKLQSKAQSGDMPDLYSVVDANVMAPYYKAGWAMDLTDELAGDWGDTFVPAALDLWAFQDGNSLDVPAGTYSVHWDTNTYAMLVDPNTTGMTVDSPPATMGDFLDTVSGAGEGQFSIAASLTPWLVASYATNYLTDEEIDATFAGESSWESDGWRKTFELFEQMRDAGVLANASIPGGTDDNANVEKAFFNTRTIASAFDQTAAIGVARSTAPDYTDFASIVIPAADDATEDARNLARPGKGVAVNPKGDHPKEALAFAKWLTEPAQQQRFADAVGTLPTAADLAGGELSPQIQGFADAAANPMAVSNTMTTDVVSAIGSGVQSIVLGEKSVDDVLRDVQSAQELSQ